MYYTSMWIVPQVMFLDGATIKDTEAVHADTAAMASVTNRISRGEMEIIRPQAGPHEHALWDLSLIQ